MDYSCDVLILLLVRTLATVFFLAANLSFSFLNAGKVLSVLEHGIVTSEKQHHASWDTGVGLLRGCSEFVKKI